MTTEIGRLLLVEDNPNDAELTLGELGKYMDPDHVDHVTDGVDAMDFLRRTGRWANRPDGAPLVVLLDLKLPRMGGMEVLQAIKDDPALCLTPVVVLTSSREDRDLLESYRLGVNAYVVKPVGFQAFAEAIRGIGLFWAILNEPPPRRPR